MPPSTKCPQCGAACAVVNECCCDMRNLPTPIKRATAGALSRNADLIAPVSGCRCRGCGRSPKLRAPDEWWRIEGLAAWCPDCDPE